MSAIENSSLITKLLHPNHPLDIEELRKRNIYFLILLLAIPTFIIFGVTHLLTGPFAYGIVNLLMAGSLLFSLIVLRTLERGIIIFRLFSLAFFLVVFSWTYQGTMEGTSAFWLLCFPFITFTLLEKTEGLVWTFVIYVCCLSIFIKPEWFSSHVYPLHFKIRLNAVFIIISLFCYNYESIRLRFWKELSNKNRKLELEMVERRKVEEALNRARNNLEARIEARTIELLKTNETLRQEINDRKGVENRLRTSEERFRQLADLLPQTVFEMNTEGFITYANQHGLKFSGYTEEQIDKGLHISTIFQGAEYERIQENIAHIFNESSPEENEFEFTNQSGDKLTVLIYSRRVLEGDRVKGLRGVLLDITHRKRFEEELLKAKEEAERANIAKSNFLAHMSHELRTPMNGVLGITELLLLTDLDEEQRKYLDTISNSGSALLKILNDILDLSRIEANKYSIEPVGFELRKAVDNIVGLFAGSIAIKGLHLNTNLDETIPDFIVGDPIRLGQVLSNIISNAQKFTEKGQIDLNITSVQETEESITLLFEVIDTGIGISHDNLPLIFESFSQVDSSPTRRHGGAGLGLTIAKNIIDLMGGKLDIDSTIGKGARFWFELSFQKDNDRRYFRKNAPSITQKVIKKEDLWVLVVDDDRLSRIIVKEMLEKMGFDVDLAVNGEEALKKLLDREYAIIFMDCLMTGMDGFETSKRIREINIRGSFSDYLPIIALTGKAMKEDIELCYDAGMDDIIIKPVSFSNLRDILDRYLT